MSSPRCPGCQASLEPAAIDHARDIATCGSCGRLVDLRAQASTAQADAAAPGRARAPVPMPPGMTLSVNMLGDDITIRRPWLRSKHWVMLLVFGCATAAVVHFWSTTGASTLLIVATIAVLTWDYNLACMFLNRTEVHATPERISVRHAPLPSVFGFDRQVRREDLEQLYAARHGAAFAVRAKLRSGATPLNLVAPLISADQALFVEQQLERAMGLVDFAMEGELDESGVMRVDGKPQAGARSGAAIALIIPAIAAGAIGVFVMAARTELSGTLRASGEAGAWQFSPDDCFSGQREGFAGVVLTSEATPERRVRVLDDPVRGALVVIATQGQPNRVVDSSRCARFQLSADRTSTSINDIWVVEGSASVECDELAGTVTFAGCH